MTTAKRIVSAVAFAVLWTAVMVWWSAPERSLSHVVVLSVIGAGLGVLWYWMAGWLQQSNG